MKMRASSPDVTLRSALRSAPAMNTERLVLEKDNAFDSGLACDEFKFLGQFIQRAQIKYVYGRTGTVKNQHADVVIADYQANRPLFRR